MPSDELIDLDKEGWRALSTSGAAAADFYDRVPADAVVMLLPGGMRLADREKIVTSMSGQPWRHANWRTYAPSNRAATPERSGVTRRAETRSG